MYLFIYLCLFVWLFASVCTVSCMKVSICICMFVKAESNAPAVSQTIRCLSACVAYVLLVEDKIDNPSDTLESFRGGCNTNR